LAVLSVAIAEVTVASSPFAFINPLKGLFLVTFYGSHLLIFAWLTFRKGWPSLPTLWFAGVLFGLYEFYITKVLWSPPWGDAISLAHVDVISFVVLAFFWHPFMAFIFPLAIGESAGSATSWVRSQLPTWLTTPGRQRATWVPAVVVVSLATFFGSPVVVLVAVLSAGLAVTVSLWWWRRDPQRVQWSLRDLLPNTKQAKGIGLLLAIQYLVFIPAWRPEAFPPLLGHVVVWLLYGGFGFLLAAALRRNRIDDPEAVAPVSTSWSRKAVLSAGALIALAMLGSLSPVPLGVFPVWGLSIIIGVRMFSRSIRYAVDRDRQPVRVT
jgi:hypothetical protein